MRKLSNVVSEAIARDEILRAGKAQVTLRRWEEVVGPMLASKSTPDRYDHGTVWVAVSGSAWAQELRMVKNQILAKLRELSGDAHLFSDVRFGVRPLTVPEATQEEKNDTAAEYRKSIEGLSIHEIRERRMNRWRNEKSD